MMPSKMHDAIKDANLSSTMSANSSLDMNMLRFQLLLHRLINLPITGVQILLKGNRALVTKHYVIESVTTLQGVHAMCSPTA